LASNSVGQLENNIISLAVKHCRTTLYWWSRVNSPKYLFWDKLYWSHIQEVHVNSRFSELFWSEYIQGEQLYHSSHSHITYLLPLYNTMPSMCHD